MDRVSEEERGKSKRSDMRGKGKGEKGFMKGRRRRKQNVMNLMDGWMDGIMYEYMDDRVEELVSDQTGGVQEKGRIPK